MATQENLVKGFLTESGPRRASNMRWVYGNDSGNRYICGGRNGEEALLAEHEPINHVKIYRSYPSGFRMHRYDVREQVRTIQHAVANFTDATDTTYQVEACGEPPRTDDRDDVPVNTYGGTSTSGRTIE